MKLLLYHGISVPSWIIHRWCFNQPETHAAVEIEAADLEIPQMAQINADGKLKAGMVIEAAWFKARNSDGSVAPRGVRVTSDWTVGHTPKTICDVYEFNGMPHAVLASALEYMLGRVGRGYDLRGLWGFALRRHSENPEKDFCSELIATAFKVSHWPLLRAREPWTIPPADLKQSRWVDFFERRMVK